MTNLQNSDPVPRNPQQIANAQLASRMGDLSLVLSAQGIISQVRINDGALANLVSDNWNDQNLADLATQDSLSAVADLLAQGKEAGGKAEEIVWEDISITLPDDTLLPLRLGLVAQSGEENLLAVGRDMRTIAGLRQQLLNAQLTVEQDYWRLRMVETRYRSLFQMVADALIVVDDETGKVLESNAAANNLLVGEGSKLVGKKFPCGFDSATTKKIESFIEEVRVSGSGDLSNLAIERDNQAVSITASMLRQTEDVRLLLRICAASETAGVGLMASRSGPTLDGYLMDAPDAVVLTNIDGTVVSANHAFIALSELRNADQVIGRDIGSWIGKTSVETNVLISNLKRHRVVKLFATQIRGEFDSFSEVEISASQTTINNADYFLFMIRDVSRRISADSEETARLPGSVAQITDQIGRVPLKELVKQSTSVIEKLCIETALEITNDNRASAAELLGLSRQSLYAKLRQYDLGNLSK